MSPTLTDGERRRRATLRALATLDTAQARWEQARDDLTERRQIRDGAVDAARAAGVKLVQIADMVGQTRVNAAHKYGPNRDVPVDAVRTAPLRAAKVRALTRAQSAVDAAQRQLQAAEVGRVQAVAACRQLDITWAVIAARVGMAQPNAVSHFRRRLRVEHQVTVTVVDSAGGIQ